MTRWAAQFVLMTFSVLECPCRVFSLEARFLHKTASGSETEPNSWVFSLVAVGTLITERPAQIRTPIHTILVP